MENARIEKRDGIMYLVAPMTKETRQYAKDGRGHKAGDNYETFVVHTNGLTMDGKTYRFDLSMPMKAWKEVDSDVKKKLLATLKKFDADKAKELKDASVDEITKAIQGMITNMLTSLNH